MDLVEGVTLVIGTTSVVLAIVAIWLSLHHKTQVDNAHVEVSKALSKILAATDRYRELLNVTREIVLEGLIPKVQASPGDDVLSNVHMESDGVRKASVPDDDEEARAAGPASEAPNETVDKFVDVTRRISEGTGFTGEDRDLAIELATELAKVERRPPRFVIALTKLIAALAAADQSTYVDLLDDMFSTVTLKEPNLNAIVLAHLGQSILAVHEPTTLERFHRHCAAARNLGNFAGSLSPSAVFYFKHNEQGALRATLREVAELPREHRVAIREYMERMSEPTDWMRVVTPQGERVAATYKEFLAEYRDRLA